MEGERLYRFRLQFVSARNDGTLIDIDETEDVRRTEEKLPPAGRMGSILPDLTDWAFQTITYSNAAAVGVSAASLMSFVRNAVGTAKDWRDLKKKPVPSLIIDGHPIDLSKVRSAEEAIELIEETMKQPPKRFEGILSAIDKGADDAQKL